MVPFMPSMQPLVAAVRTESAALSAVVAGLTEADLARPSPCPPWSIAGLLGHIIVATSRVGQAITAGQEPGAAGPLITAAGYYRPDHRFSAPVNADRIDVAASLAARLDTVAAISAELATACQGCLALLEAAGPGQEVRTRHGDRMLLSDFAVTRVVELAVHGLDVAAGLGRRPWLTDDAAAVLEDLMLPGGAASALAARLGCDRAGLIARLTGRTPLSAADQAALAESGVAILALG
jgi:uncharacterized protein (TIGR03083 family)